ncbi:MAG: polyprenyltransferase, partial [Symploca sp. SIO1B1]|nr:polyprenyltransferase [Symploca sp. SIO1B1]
MNSASLKSQPLWAYLQLMRPANIITAWADILAGYAASGLVLLLTQVQTEPVSFVPLA